MPTPPAAPPAHRSARTEGAVVAALAVAGLAWFAVRRDDTTQLVSNLGLIAASLAGSAGCFLRARSTTPDSRRVWLCFGASLACWGLGQATWTWYEQVVGRTLPFPSAADIGYLAAVPFAVAGLLSLPSEPGARYGRARVVLDGMVIASSLLFVSWVVVLERGLAASADSWVTHVIGLAYPIGDAVVITVALATLARSWRGARLASVTLLMVLSASVCLAVADTGFYYLALDDRYVSGHPIDIAWFLGFALFLLAARRPAGTTTAEDDPGVPRRAAVAMPYLAVLLAIVAATFKRLSEDRLGDAAFAMLIVVMVLLVARQYVAILENSSLARTLEDRVRVRTAELHDNEERFRSLVQHSSDVVTIVDRDGRIRYQSESLTRVFGYEPEPLAGEPFTDLVRPDDRAHLAEVFRRVGSRAGEPKVAEFQLLHADGRWRRCATTVTNLLHVPSVSGLVLNTSDVSEQKSLEDQLVHQAFHDSLTSLANRALFHDRLSQALVRGHRFPRPVAVLFCDLDGFKAVNDGYGHASGDRVLVEVANRLLACVRPADTVARLGGDEFGILLDDAAGESEALAVASRIRESLREPVILHGREVFVSASVGIAASTHDDDTADSLLSDADLAMYRAKARGVGGYERFHVAMRPTTDAMELGNDLHHALARGELLVHYQPVLWLDTGCVAGMEALVRWEHPERGLLPADRFVPLAERSRLILDIGRWVLAQACRETADLQARGVLHPRAFVAVNVSGRHVHDPALVGDVVQALDHSGLAPANLLLEMTESVLIEHSEETLATLEALKDLGARLAIDDFGTGYSSLSYVHRLPVDVLKIDQSFIEQLGDTNRTGLAEWVVRIGHALGLETVAEGIEDPGQLAALRAMRCELGQGFHLAHPLAPAELASYLRPREMSPNVVDA